MSDLFERLAAPFDPSEIDWRVGSTTAAKDKGMALAYVDARAVMDRLDVVVGPANWQSRYSIISEGKTVCELSIKVDGEWVTKSDGAGDSDYEAAKGALSDAFKRAAVRWGIGRYLYTLDSPWVPIEARGKSYIIKDEGKRTLEALLRRHGAPSPTPSNEPTPEDKAKAWYGTALGELKDIRTQRDLTKWSEDNGKRLAWLLKLNKQLSDKLQDAIDLRADSFRPRAAAE